MKNFDKKICHVKKTFYLCRRKSIHIDVDGEIAQLVRESDS